MLQLIDGLKRLQLNYIPSIGNFITVDVNDAMTIYQKLLYEGVIVRPLSAYGMPKHIRVTIGTPEQNSRFLTAMQKVRRVYASDLIAESEFC
jgi:histidinol-phosphate aminotransferase